MKPLYEQIRPQTLDQIVGQEHLIGTDGKISLIVRSQKPSSLILHGPPGTGKTTIARLYAKAFNLPFHSATGVLQSTAELKQLLTEGAKIPLLRRQILLFLDEIHRLNKAQQDLFLPFLEEGSLILVGATTENPSFSLNNALLSRVRTFTLKPLDTSALLKIIDQCEATVGPLNIPPEWRTQICDLSLGDARFLIHLVEAVSKIPVAERTSENLSRHLNQRPVLYDRDGDEHHNLISALHKSVRGSDPDAALYWLARMLQGGEDPLFIARRVVRMASEDIGLADPQALTITLNAHQTYQMLGSPEGELALAEAVIYLSLAPKSNAIYKAFGQAKEAAEKTPHLPPPKEILNAPTRWMKEQGLGKGYLYDHDSPDGFSGQSYFPPEMERPTFYQPVARGFEREMIRRIQYFLNLRASRNGGSL